jgi:hypothetical protein
MVGKLLKRGHTGPLPGTRRGRDKETGDKGT